FPAVRKREDRAALRPRMERAQFNTFADDERCIAQPQQPHWRATVPWVAVLLWVAGEERVAAVRRDMPAVNVPPVFSIDQRAGPALGVRAPQLRPADPSVRFLS